MPHEFELRKQVTLEATPEQVWEAIATGPGIDSWFMGRNEIEPRLGGATRQYFGDIPAAATVTAWEPAKRFAFRSDDNPDGSFMAFEYLIEGREQGSTVLRLVHSGILGDDWETEYDALNRGWDMYLHTLGQYLTHFRGRSAAVVFGALPQAGGGIEPAWDVLERGLGLTGPVAKGDRVRLTPEGLPPIEGVADYAAPDFLGVRTEDGLYRFIRGGHDTLVIGHHIFSGVDPKETEQAWQGWLAKLPA
ncbi:SRPBCC family protein [Sphaerisporangium perillae]|uniref:SRPBCC family protein n=1 Tax=Sphaerisporangium perillae TaxID=2935860 RepID=UPI00200C4BD1|nr:SRPBCC domain-containing protein [Sphaerisporangium perillae]